MSQTTLRIAFQAARPLHTTRNPTAFFRSCRHATTSSNPRASIPRSPNSLTQTLHRSISTTSSRQATAILKNPRVDEDGEAMTIDITEKAARRLRQITTTPPPKNTLTSSSSSNPDSHLRVTVTSGGCHGFQYLMVLEQASKIDEEDTIFAAETEGSDSTTNKGRAEVVMDSASLELLKGSTVDFTQELIGSQFKIVGNPRASSSCGCGTSFDIE